MKRSEHGISDSGEPGNGEIYYKSGSERDAK